MNRNKPVFFAFQNPIAIEAVDLNESKSIAESHIITRQHGNEMINGYKSTRLPLAQTYLGIDDTEYVRFSFDAFKGIIHHFEETAIAKGIKLILTESIQSPALVRALF